ncbi:hypothetical protein [Alienimonas sp. DA493]|uniref:hypothetical protein n=1 Tax=Alienimonas sp. DA493 TaxID=3373605 RepID=UPI003753F210
MLRPARRLLIAAAAICAVSATLPAARAQGVVPGSGKLLTQALDDFEAEDWTWIPNSPKSSNEDDNQRRYPAGRSANGFWAESMKRGMPDHILRIPTPPGGLPGSKGSLLICTLNSGIPGRTSYEPMQDDLILNCSQKVGQIPVSRSPNFTVRVWMPAWEDWSTYKGSHFGIRGACRTTTSEQKGKFIFTRSVQTTEPYWPGMFIQYLPRGLDDRSEPCAAWIIRGNNQGNDYRGPVITKPGWWTVGMSFTPDGRVHYYLSEGVDELTVADHVGSAFPYGFRAEQFVTLFFNSLSKNNGVEWGTPFVVDDPKVYSLY